MREVIDRDIYATANLLVRRHGRSAGYFAAGRADELADRGDHDGARVWRRILAAVETLLDDDPSGKLKH